MSENTEDNKLHHRNKHRNGYDFEALVASSPELLDYVIISKYGNKSINFFDSAAVKALNRALLIHFYNIKIWDLPEGYLCPPIPGRADYIHNIADLLSNGINVTTGPEIKVLDIGIGANCVYPIIGHQEYGWSFTGSDIDQIALNAAQQIINSNPDLTNYIELRLQPVEDKIFSGIIAPNDHFTCTICNPPFHSSKLDAYKGNLRKTKGISGIKGKEVILPALNFGGQPNELWCQGGESSFIQKMINESLNFSRQVEWFTTLVSKESNLPAIYKMLKKVKITNVKTIHMSQGNKKSRIIAWSYK